MYFSSYLIASVGAGLLFSAPFIIVIIGNWCMKKLDEIEAENENQNNKSE